MDILSYRLALWLLRVSIRVNGRALQDLINLAIKQAHAPEKRPNGSPWG